MQFSRPITDIIGERFSCRTYSPRPISEGPRRLLGEAAAAVRSGPFGSALRFKLVASGPTDAAALKGLGTYGAIHDPAGFMIGAATRGEKYLEDFGYAMECLILTATDMGLGTCWLGGFFTRGSFSRRVGLKDEERIPAVASVGEIVDRDAAREGFMRRMARGARRLPAAGLFFDDTFATALSSPVPPSYSTALEMLRLAPSASNRQPWRIVRQSGRWHFCLARTAGYRAGLGEKLLKLEDIQRVDMGIAMCHFELALQSLGSSGRWVTKPPASDITDGRAEFVATWEET